MVLQFHIVHVATVHGWQRTRGKLHVGFGDTERGQMLRLMSNGKPGINNKD